MKKNRYVMFSYDEEEGKKNRYFKNVEEFRQYRKKSMFPLLLEYVEIWDVVNEILIAYKECGYDSFIILEGIPKTIECELFAWEKDPLTLFRR